MNQRDSLEFAALQAHLLLKTPLGTLAGTQRIALLEAIAQHGSIARAAKTVPLSYKAAWEAVDDMNNLCTQPLVQRSSGGARGGGTTLTPYAHRLIAFYRVLEAEHQLTTQRLQRVLNSAQAGDVASFKQVLRRWAMQSSARNQFVGQVTELLRGSVETQVQLSIAPGVMLAAVVTDESVERLKLGLGMEVHALVKSSSVMLIQGDVAQISARNRFSGQVVRLLRGPVNAEVTLQLSDHHLQMTAVMTDDSVQRLGLAIGSQATAFFKASSVILAVAA